MIPILTSAQMRDCDIKCTGGDCVSGSYEPRGGCRA